MGIDELRAKRDEILRIAARHGARNVRVFGSIVRGEEGPKSDVDFLVDMEPGRSLLDLIAFEQDVEDMLRCKVDVLSEGGVYYALRDRIFQEAVAL
ncbi:MAG: nucleotidyltransferase family protein [Candidatus Brocadiae bacterium]|nr:nucleotidyltransferase family protein [Candidatus Brocadiia bacterium]